MRERKGKKKKRKKTKHKKKITKKGKIRIANMKQTERIKAISKE